MLRKLDIQMQNNEIIPLPNNVYKINPKWVKHLNGRSLSVWVSPAKARVSSGLAWGQGLCLQQTWEVWRVSPTTEPPSRQPTNWRAIIPKKFSYCCASSRACNRFPNLGIQQRGWEPPGNLTLKANGIWLQNIHRTRETDSWRAQTKSCVHQDLGERSNVRSETIKLLE